MDDLVTLVSVLGIKIRVILSDNGGKFISKQFKECCQYHAIEQQFTAPYTSIQNGVGKKYKISAASCYGSMT